MSSKFELFHLSLLERTQPNLFDDFTNMNREEWLRKVFSEEQSFEHYGFTFHYVPSKTKSDVSKLLGKIGRKVLRDENKSPAENFESVTHETWKAAILVLDPVHHEDGQKVAIQHIKEVGSPSQLVAKLIERINEMYRGQYSVQVAQIIEEQSFWDFVHQNEGNVTSVTLECIPPNMWGTKEEFDSDLKELRENEGAKKVKITIENDEGIKPDTEKMRNAVRYTARGGGKIKAKAKNNKYYNSQDKVKRTIVEDVQEISLDGIEIEKMLNRILGRE